MNDERIVEAMAEAIFGKNNPMLADPERRGSLLDRVRAGLAVARELGAVGAQPGEGPAPAS